MMEGQQVSIKRLSQRNKYYLPIEARRAMIHFAMRYQEWRNEYDLIGGTGTFNMDGMPHGTNTIDTTERDGIRRAELAGKMKLIEETVRETTRDGYEWMYEYLLKGVTQAIGYTYLREVCNMPCGKNLYYEKTREFYWRLEKKI